MKETRGRPSDYTPELLQKAREYIDGGWADAGKAIPSVAGLAVHLGKRRETLHVWAKESGKEQFSNMLEEMLAKQEDILLNAGLLNEHNPTITKLVLSKHGYSDRVETKNEHDVADPMKELLAHVATNGRRVGD